MTQEDAREGEEGTPLLKSCHTKDHPVRQFTIGDTEDASMTTTATATTSTTSTTNSSTTAIPADASVILEDCLQFIRLGMEAIANDEFSRCFAPKSDRDGTGASFADAIAVDSLSLDAVDWRTLCMSWPYRLADLSLRYGFLLPLRLTIFLMGTVVFFVFLPVAYYSNLAALRHLLFLFYCKVWMVALGAGWGTIRHHGVKPRLPQGEPNIFVANHSSFIDFFVLSSHQFAHATVAQQHAGLMGWLQTYVLTMNGSLMFHRSVKGDRHALAEKMKAHVHQQGPHTSPLLIFPEGTCVNNEFTVLFHRGAFALDATICPVAIKYDKTYGDPYWMSSRQSFLQHVFYLMTRRALIADVWWLPPERIQPGEDATGFAMRVKQKISKQAGLTCLSWDGYMKNYLSEEKRGRMKAHQQVSFTNQLRSRQQHYMRQSSPGKPAPSLARIPSGTSLLSSFPAHLSSQQVVDMKNQILLDLSGKLPSPESANATTNAAAHASSNSTSSGHMLHVWDVRKADIVRTWKKYTRVKEQEQQAENHARRMENSSWRMWFKERLQRVEGVEVPVVDTVLSSVG